VFITLLLQSFEKFEEFAELAGSFELDVAILEDHEALEMAVGNIAFDDWYYTKHRFRISK